MWPGVSPHQMLCERLLSYAFAVPHFVAHTAAKRSVGEVVKKHQLRQQFFFFFYQQIKGRTAAAVTIVLFPLPTPSRRCRNGFDISGHSCVLGMSECQDPG